MRQIEAGDIHRAILHTASIDAHGASRLTHEYVDARLRLDFLAGEDDYRQYKHRVLSDLLGHLSYRRLELIDRVFDRVQRTHSAGCAAAAGVRCLDMVHLWASFAATMLDWRHVPMVRAEAYEQWRRSFHDLDEDVPKLAWLVLNESDRPYDSSDELYKILKDWPTFIAGDDLQLAQELRRGLACQHVHLTGAYPAPFFWVALMNRRFDPKSITVDRGDRRYALPIDAPERMRDNILRAAALRFLLWRWLEDPTPEVAQQIAEATHVADNSIFTQMQPFDELKKLRSCSTSEHRFLFLDYAQHLALPLAPRRSHPDEEALRSVVSPSLLGERALLLRLLAKIRLSGLTGEPPRVIAQAFWRYVQIKNQFLGTVQQREGYSGFDFFEYTLRHLEMPHNLTCAVGGGHVDSMLETQSWYREVGSFLQESKSVLKLELMVAPRTSADDYKVLLDNIRGHLVPVMNDRLAPNLKQQGAAQVEIGFVVHFIKNEDRSLSSRQVKVDGADEPCAYNLFHGTLREKIQREAAAIEAVLREDPEFPICAIDTANRELHCPPEVFAPTYRRFRRHLMRRTFHVGEDFLHLTTGIRRIYEALEYLDLRAGDRLGHCVALGIDARQWIHTNPFVTMHRIDLLDDATFEWALLQEYGATELHRLSHLERRIARQSMAIFGEPVDPHILWESWRRRGDNPPTDSQGQFVNHVPEWIKAQGTLLYAGENAPDAHIGAHSYVPSAATLQQLSKVPLPTRELPRDQAERVLLEYLYDRRTIVREIELEVVETAGELPYLVRLQEIVRSLIKSRGITVESNPSSNWLIGGLERLYDAPAVQWTLRHPDFPITINPDDPTVFATSIENEYFYVFSCLLKGTDDVPGLSRLEALERIRKLREHGLASSFLQSGPAFDRTR